MTAEQLTAEQRQRTETQMVKYGTRMRRERDEARTERDRANTRANSCEVLLSNQRHMILELTAERDRLRAGMRELQEWCATDFTYSTYRGPGTDPTEFPGTHVPSFIHAAWLAGLKQGQLIVAAQVAALTQPADEKGAKNLQGDLEDIYDDALRPNQ